VDNVIVMDVADLITAAEIGHLPTISVALKMASHAKADDVDITVLLDFIATSGDTTS
jgi:hypothetical protein